MIPVLLAFNTWAFAFSLVNWGFGSAISLHLACMALFALSNRKRGRLIILSGVAISLLLSAAVSASLLVATSDSGQLSEHSFEVVNAQVLLDSKISRGFWQAELVSLGSKKMHGNVLLADQTGHDFKQGCLLVGKMRLVPFQSNDRPWLLKLAPANFSQKCSDDSPFVSLRNKFLKSLRGPSQDSKALVAGLAVGDTSLLSDQTKAQMKILSLTHLTAVSGANCAIVLGLVFLCLSKLSLRRWLRTSLSIGALILYLQLVGPQPSVLRAAFMSLTILLMITAGRAVGAMTALSWATILLLCLNPFFSGDFGFALSVAATGGILVVSPWFYKWLRFRIPGWLAAVLAVSAAAQIWCAPILLQLQGGIPTYALLANALVEPLVAPITVLGILACILCIVSPLLAGMVSWLASIPAFLIIGIVRKLQALPFATLWWPSGVMGIVLMAALALSLSLRALNVKVALAKNLATACVLALIFVASFGFFRSTGWPIKDWQIINCDVGQGDALLIRSNEQVALVDVGRDPKPIDDCLTHLGVTTINLLVLTHFDADHVGGLSGALDRRHVITGMVTDYPDNRSQALAMTEELRRSSDRMLTAFAGLHGFLGSISWLVLQPELHGSGSDDPNDGSICMRWNAADFTLFTMADLGEKGQMRLAQLHPGWLNVNRRLPVVLKVSHHGSADQYPELIEALKPQLALISVGRGNPYGHPTRATLKILSNLGTDIFRTDNDGPISVNAESSSHTLSVATGD